jgi:hypothetical protein
MSCRHGAGAGTDPVLVMVTGAGTGYQVSVLGVDRCRSVPRSLKDRKKRCIFEKFLSKIS